MDKADASVQLAMSRVADKLLKTPDLSTLEAVLFHEVMRLRLVVKTLEGELASTPQWARDGSSPASSEG